MTKKRVGDALENRQGGLNRSCVGFDGLDEIAKTSPLLLRSTIHVFASPGLSIDLTFLGAAAKEFRQFKYLFMLQTLWKQGYCSAVPSKKVQVPPAADPMGIRIVPGESEFQSSPI